MLDDGVLARTRPAEIHALRCGPFPVGEFAPSRPGSGCPARTAAFTLTERARRLADEIGALGTASPPATPEALERLVTDLQTAVDRLRLHAGPGVRRRRGPDVLPSPAAGPYFGAFTPEERAARPAELSRRRPGSPTTSTDIESVIPLDTYRYWT
ncbi:hypothetical protein ABZ912_25840 [Nonomuraea angiospora]|uniref:hypothetical protein n=1 Tax=Nonomuraea angiospora TaxID=46172 RepID=UPI00340C3457